MACNDRSIETQINKRMSNLLELGNSMGMKFSIKANRLPSRAIEMEGSSVNL